MQGDDVKEAGAGSRSLRFAVMCRTTTFAEWQARCLRKLMELGNVEPVLLIRDDGTSNLLSKARKVRPTKMLFQFFSRAISRPPALRSVDMTDELADVPRIGCRTIRRGKFSEYFSEEDIERIRESGVDFILRFGFNIIRGDILKVARYGVWSFHHDDERKYRGSPPCFWEIYNGDPVTGAMLQKLTNRLDGGVVLKKGFFPTIDYSYGSNVNRAYQDSASWPAQVCVDILNGNAQYVQAAPSQTKAPIYYHPNNFQMVWFLLKLARNFSAKVYKILFCHEEWNVGIIKEPITNLLADQPRPAIHWLSRPKRGSYIADPFGIVTDGKVSVLCEDFDYGPFKGVISSIEISDSGVELRREVAINGPFHLSYPYLFEYQQALYCIPEVAESHEVPLYRSEGLPTRWTKVATLIEQFAGADMTIFEHEGRLWMTGSNAEDGRWDKLFIWHAADLFGPWTPHAQNPVKIDIRSARPAGTPFTHQGSLFRPAQDCSKTYGGQIVINRVTKLTPTAFEEEPAKTIRPDPESMYPSGMHTISRAGDFTLVDGKRYVFTIGGLAHALRFFFRRTTR